MLTPSSTPVHSLLHPTLPWWQHIDWQRQRRREIRYQRHQGLPSIAARSAWEDYYRDLYSEHEPDFSRYAELLFCFGVPDFINPAPAGFEEHYAFHPLGTMAADLTALSEPLAQELTTQLPGKNPVKTKTSSEPVPPWRQQARASWLLMLLEAAWRKSEGLPWFANLAAAVHPDNLWLVSLDSVNALSSPELADQLKRWLGGADKKVITRAVIQATSLGIKRNTAIASSGAEIPI